MVLFTPSFIVYVRENALLTSKYKPGSYSAIQTWKVLSIFYEILSFPQLFAGFTCDTPA